MHIEEKWLWSGDKLRCFSISSAYQILNNFHVMENNGGWQQIWKLDVAVKKSES